MFPISMSPGAVADRILQADDVAGISDLYPTPAVGEATGSISGTVTKDARGVFGAHVAAFNMATGAIIANFTLTDRGEFVIARLPAGVYVVRAEPLDDADAEGFFTVPIDVNFQVAYATRAIVVSEGAGGWADHHRGKAQVRQTLVFVVALCGCVATAAAQDSDPALRAHRFTIAGGVSWLGGYPIGSNTATLRRNEIGTPTPGGFTLFAADASLQQAAGVDAKVGFGLTRTVAVEFGGGYARPRLAVEITADQESPSVVLADEDISQYTVEAAVLWQISQLDLGRRARPYVSVGGGYLRQLYENRVKVETGRVAHIGGGVRYWLRGGDSRAGPSAFVPSCAPSGARAASRLPESARVFPVANFRVLRFLILATRLRYDRLIMAFASLDTFKTKTSLKSGEQTVSMYCLQNLEAAGFPNITRLPFSLKILLENLLRREDDGFVKADDISALASWTPTSTTRKEISFMPARVLLQDFTGVPCVVDLAAMRDGMTSLGGDPQKINPLQPVELVIDHSVQVDYFGTRDALQLNSELEYQRNHERYVVPAMGAERVSATSASCRPTRASCIRSIRISGARRRSRFVDGRDVAYPDTCSAPIRTRRWSMAWASWAGASAASKPRRRCSASRCSMLIPQVVGFDLPGAAGRSHRDRPRAHRHRDAAQEGRRRQVRRVFRHGPRT